MVQWIGKFSLLLKRLRDAWMDMLPMSSNEQVTTHEMFFPFSDNLTTLNSLLQVISVKPEESDRRVLFLSRE